MRRRDFIGGIGGAAATSAFLARRADAQAYPTRPVRIIIGFGPGGIGDIIARLIGQWLSERLGQQFVVENRPGAGSTIAAETVARSAPDGYTLLMASGADTYNATLFQNLNFNFVRDITPVASIARSVGVMEVHPSVAAKTGSEFIAYAKANPGKINVGVISGGATHLWAELFKAMAGVDVVAVYYRGPAALMTDLISGQVQLLFDPLASSIEHIRAGELRALAVTSLTRSPALPDIPSLAEFVTGYEATGWNGLCAPRNIPEEIVNRLNKEVNAALVDPRMKERLASFGGVPLPLSPAEFGKLIVTDTGKWANVIHAANIKLQ